MQEKNRKTESVAILLLKLAAAVFCALAMLLLLTIPGCGICLLLGSVAHETVYAWLKIPLFLITGYVAGRIFASSCSLKGIVCAGLTTTALLGILLVARRIPGVEGAGLWLAALAILLSSVLGSVVSTCRRS